MNTDVLAQISGDTIHVLAESALRGIILAGLIALLLWLLRARNSSIQLMAWTAVLYAAITLPLLALFLPKISIPIPIKQTQPSAASLISDTAEGNERTSTPTRPTLGVSEHQGRTASHAHSVTVKGRALLEKARKYLVMPWPMLGLLAYLISLTVLMGRFAFGLAITRRLRRAAVPVEDWPTLQLFQHYARKLRISRTPWLVESSFVSVPLTFGILRPVIVMPSDCRRWEEAKLAAVMAHELSHVKQRDPLVHTLAILYRNVYWFSPLGWWLERQLSGLAEQASDEAAVSTGTEPSYYAEVLMSFIQAGHGLGRVNWQGVWMTRGKRTVNRIERVLSLKERSEGKFKKALLVMTIGGVVPVACLAAAMHPKFAITSDPTVQTPQQPSAEIAASPMASAASLSAAHSGSTASPSSPSNVLPIVNIASAVWPATVREDDNDNWTFHSSRNGMNFAVVSGTSIIMNGSEADRGKVDSRRKKISGDFIWFIQNGNEYVIQDAAMVKAAKQLYAPMEKLSRQQEELGRQQEELGKQQEALGNQMESTRVDVPGDLLERLHEIEAEIKAFGPSAKMDDLGRLQGELGDLQGRLGALQGQAGAEQGRLGQQQGALGAKQGELGHRQGELGREQARIAREAERQVQDIIAKAIANGSAKRVD